MKAYKYITGMWTLVTCVGLVSCQDETVEADHIFLSADSYTFRASGEETFRIEVKTDLAWEAAIEGDWILESARDQTSLTIGVQPNTDINVRTGKVTFSAKGVREVFLVEQLSPEHKGTLRNLDDMVEGTVSMSPGGQYVAGTTSEILPDDSYQFTPTIIETATGKRITLDPTAIYNGVRAISDNGEVVVLCHDGNVICALTSIDNTPLEQPTLPGGYDSPFIEGISADGSIMVGYCHAEGSRQITPVKWTNGTPEILSMPQKNAYGDPLVNGVMARGCSADGSVIYGSEWDWQVPVVWDKSGKVSYAGEEHYKPHSETIEGFFGPVEIQMFDRPIMNANIMNISPNGKYVAGYFTEEYIESGYVYSNNYPFLYDTETGKSEILKDLPDVTALTACDDGTYFLGYPVRGTMNSYVYSDGPRVELSQWLEQQYGIALTDDRVVYRVSSDGKVYFGARPVFSMLGLSFLWWYYRTDAETIE